MKEIKKDMTSDGQDRFRDTLLIEKFASIFHFDDISTSLFGSETYGPHLLLGSMITLSYAFRAPLLLAEPWRLATSTTLIGGLWLGLLGALYMRNGYATAVAQLQLGDRQKDHDHSQFERIVPLRIQIAIFIIAVVATYPNVFFGMGLNTLISEEGMWPVLVRLFIAVPLAYYPVVIDVGTMFFFVHFQLPRRLAKSDLNLFFYDPRNMGGFAPIGQLLKRSYYIYTGGLLAYFFFIYIPIIFSRFIQSSYEIPQAIGVFFSLAWLAGLLSIGYSMWKIHTLMAEKKEQRLQELEGDLRSIIKNPYDIRSSSVSEEARLEKINRQLDHVRSMKEYPTTFTMWSQILISVILPQVLNMSVQFVG